MIKMTIATDAHGNLLGAVQHGAPAKDASGMSAGVSFGAGAQLHTIDVDPSLDMTKVKDTASFHAALEKSVHAYRG